MKVGRKSADTNKVSNKGLLKSEVGKNKNPPINPIIIEKITLFSSMFFL